MSTPRDYLADPSSMDDNKLAEQITRALAFHHAQRDYTARQKKEDQA